MKEAGLSVLTKTKSYTTGSLADQIRLSANL